MKYKAIFFDLDGTLLNSKKGVFNSFGYAFKKMGIKEKRKNLYKYIGPPLVFSFSNYVNGERLDEAIKYFSEYYVSYGYKQGKLYPGTKKMLTLLKEKGYKLYVTTSKQEYITKEILNYLKAKEYFDAIYGADINKNRLSKIDVLNYAFNESLLKREEVILIGDTKYDAEGAKSAGIDCAFVTYGFGNDEELKSYDGVFYANKAIKISEFL